VKAVHSILRMARERARESIGKVVDVRARALLEVSAEVRAGLIKAYSDFEAGQEPGWREPEAGNRASSGGFPPTQEVPESLLDPQEGPSPSGVKRIRKTVEKGATSLPAGAIPARRGSAVSPM
jgi:hypothetical protein